MSKLYKRQYDRLDLVSLERFVGNNAIELSIKIWKDGVENVFSVSALSLSMALDLTDKYYDNISSSDKIAELIMKDKSHKFLCLYHIEGNKTGLAYEALNYAKKFRY